jgi:DNA repair exonuclease SbcCD ATPase subunit
MITLVRLSNWRAYRDVELQMESGTTFLVAMNGVGKSSLLEAVQWAFTSASKPDAECIRKGERTAEVEVELLAESTPMRIKRHLSLGAGKKPLKTPKAEVHTWIGKDEVAEDAFFDRLASVWGADNEFVTRIAFLDDRLIQQDDEPNLRAHLCQAFELDHLETEAKRLVPEIASALKLANAAHQSIKVAKRDLDAAEQAVVAQTGALSAAREQETLLRDKARAAAKALERASTNANERARLVKWDVDAESIIKDAEPHAGPISPGTDLAAVLRAARHAAERQAEDARDEKSRLTERITSLETALRALEGAEIECPVCRRPLDGDSRAHASEVHARDRELAEEQLLDVNVEQPTILVAALTNLVSRAERLGDRPLDVAGEDPDVGEAQRVSTDAQKELEVHLGELGSLQTQLTATTADRDRLLSEADSTDVAVALFRYHAHLSAAKASLEATVSEVLATQVGPVGSEVSNRWTGVFPNRPGLVVDLDGSISRDLNGDKLPYKSFSNGEKTVARLLFRLATLITTTNVPFCWIDEPLEHLDDKSKLLVARTLAMFGRDGLVKQIFVTTFQEELAIILESNKSEKVRLEYLGTEQVVA